jgi:hypothetical protein
LTAAFAPNAAVSIELWHWHRLATFAFVLRPIPVCAPISIQRGANGGTRLDVVTDRRRSSRTGDR